MSEEKEENPTKEEVYEVHCTFKDCESVYIYKTSSFDMEELEARLTALGWWVNFSETSDPNFHCPKKRHFPLPPNIRQIS